MKVHGALPRRQREGGVLSARLSCATGSKNKWRKNMVRVSKNRVVFSFSYCLSREKSGKKV